MEGQKTILVIDDNTLVLEAVSAVLELEGMNVLCADSGKEGVRIAHEAHPDCIISDYSMPEMDGCAVYEAVRRDAETARIPFVFFTAHGDPVLRERCLRMGADAIIDKGDTMGDLTLTVRYLIEHPRGEA